MYENKKLLLPATCFSVSIGIMYVGIRFVTSRHKWVDLRIALVQLILPYDDDDDDDTVTQLALAAEKNILLLMYNNNNIILYYVHYRYTYCSWPVNINPARS